MKNVLFAAVAALALAAPALLAPAYAQSNGNGYQQSQYEGASERAQERDARRQDDRGDRQGRNEDHRWNEGRHNGFYIGNRWSYGPPSTVQVRRGAVPGFHDWAVGRNLGYYNRRFEEVDYRRAHLREPPRGYRWVSDGRGEFLLAGVRSGRIIEIADNRGGDRRQSWRDDRRDASWDDDRHNGYYRNGRWTYGPPPPGQIRASAVLGYQPWTRGQRLGYYQGRYAEVDYRSRSGLRAPPRGYRWVRNDGGDYLLASIDSGLIAEVILGANR